MVEGQLRFCKEFRYDSSNLEEVLESEAELFRGEAGLGEEAPIKLFLAGDSQGLAESAGRLPVRSLSPPEPSGPSRAPARPSSADWPALVAAFCGFKRKGDAGSQPASCRVATPQIPLGMGPPLTPWRGLNVLLLLALLLQGPVQQRARAERLSRERERLQPAVSAFRKLEAERDLWRERAGLFEGHRTRNAHLLAALAELSRILPADSVATLLNPAGGAAPRPGNRRPGGGPAQDPGGLAPFRGRWSWLPPSAATPRDGRTFHLQARLQEPVRPAEPSAPDSGAADSPGEVTP